MIGALVRVVVGFALASVVAGLVLVLFAAPPAELASERSPGLATIIDWTLKAGTQTAIFAAPFALIAAAIGEWQGLRGPIFYALAGLLIAATGFLAQQSSETAGQLTVLNSYAIKAFLSAGVCGGVVYWLIAGRVAGDEDNRRDPGFVRPMPKSPMLVPAASEAKGGTAGATATALAAEATQAAAAEPDAVVKRAAAAAPASSGSASVSAADADRMPKGPNGKV